MRPLGDALGTGLPTCRRLESASIRRCSLVVQHALLSSTAGGLRAGRPADAPANRATLRTCNWSCVGGQEFVLVGLSADLRTKGAHFSKGLIVRVPHDKQASAYQSHSLRGVDLPIAVVVMTPPGVAGWVRRNVGLELRALSSWAAHHLGPAPHEGGRNASRAEHHHTRATPPARSHRSGDRWRTRLTRQRRLRGTRPPRGRIPSRQHPVTDDTTAAFEFDDEAVQRYTEGRRP